MLVRRATVDDLLNARVTAVRAFVDDPVMRWLHPDDEIYLAPGGEVFRNAFDGWHGLDEIWCTDDAAGVAVWIPPGRPEVDFGEPPDGPLPPEVQALMDRYEIIGAVMAEHTPAEPHWYLQMLATHPDWQRQGIGAALMGSMFERAATEGLPCYLETETIENVAYYRHHGFDVRSEWDVPTGPHMWGMFRPS
jgi:ribosomal protein S18 acetylase RimI-like enzyme